MLELREARELIGSPKSSAAYLSSAPAAVKSIVATLIHLMDRLGVAALINSLCPAGFDGTVVCEHRAPVQPWAVNVHPHEIP